MFIPQQGRLGGPRPPMNGGFGFKLPPTSGAFGDFFGMPPAGMMGKYLCSFMGMLPYFFLPILQRRTTFMICCLLA